MTQACGVSQYKLDGEHKSSSYLKSRVRVDSCVNQFTLTLLIIDY